MRVPILTYPTLAIGGVAYADNPLVAFAADLQAVTEAGFRIRPVRDIVDAWLAEDAAALRDVVGLCLDDGSDFDARDLDHPTAGRQRSALHAMEDFRRASPGEQPGLHATSFVVASPQARAALDKACMVGSGWWSDTWWDEALASGLMHIGNHSWDHNHEALPEELSPVRRRGTFHAIDRKDLADHEIAQSARLLRARADNPGLGLFAYPYGEAPPYLTHANLPREAESLGLVAAFTDRFGYLEATSDRWLIPRFVWGRDWRSTADLQSILREARRERRVTTSGGAPRIVDPEDRSRFERLPQILADWMKDHGGLAGKEILDFGCGQGVTALALAREHGAKRVVGVDIGPDVERAASFAHEQLGLARLPDNTRFLRVTPEALHDADDRFDLVYS